MKNIIKIILIVLLTIFLGFSIYLCFSNNGIISYTDDIISFKYNSKYKLQKQDNYIELLSDNSNITIEIRKLNNSEIRSSQTIVDNVIYNYLNTYKDYKLVSRYDEYELNNKKCTRLIFFNEKENVNSLILLNTYELKLVMVIMNSNSNEFELLMGSAEIIMNSLEIKSNIKYISVETEYPQETFSLIEDLDVNNTLEYNLKTAEKYNSKRIIGNDNVYYFTLNVPEDYSIVEDKDKWIDLKKEKVNIRYSISSYSELTTCSYSDCKTSKGYKKYNDKYYYIEQQIGKSGEDWMDYINIYDFLNYKETVRIQIVTRNKKITNDVIEKIIDYKIEKNNEHSTIEGDYIVGYLECEKYKLKYNIPKKYNFTLDTYATGEVSFEDKTYEGFQFNFGSPNTIEIIAKDLNLENDNLKVGNHIYSKYSLKDYRNQYLYATKLDEDIYFYIWFIRIEEDDYNKLNFEKEILPYFVIEKL